MKKTFVLLFSLLVANCLTGQSTVTPPQTKIMTLGVFHFAYPNLDFYKTAEKDKISVLDEPYQSEIVAIAKVIEEFHPTIIAVEINPEKQHFVDSLFFSYKSGESVLKKDEVEQLAFRIGKRLNLSKIYCVNDFGKHYENIESMFNDSVRMSRFAKFYEERDTVYSLPRAEMKINSVTEKLIEINNPEKVREELATYLLTPFKYEEQPGDFTGVDFETGRWFNRNLRIFRNIQRIKPTPEDRILLIIGGGHLNLLNPIFDISREFELVSPLPYLEKAKKR